MTMLIPFWVWILLGLVLGWWLRGFLGRKFAFLRRLRNPFGKKRRSGKGKPREKDDGVPPKERSNVEKAKSAVDKVTGLLAKPWEKLFGDFKDEEEDDDE